MSKFMPQAVLKREYDQHLKRLNHGLKMGTHVKYPDLEKGPYIIKKEQANLIEELKKKAAAEITEEQAPILAKLAEGEKSDE